MRFLNLRLKVLIAVLLTLGVATAAYQIFVQGISATEAEIDDLWNIGAKVDFAATPRILVEMWMFVPPLSQDYVSPNESFISNNYSVGTSRADGNRKVTWSAHCASDKQTLYYRLVLTKRYTGEEAKEKGPISRDSLLLKGSEKIVAEVLLAPTRQHSVDVETFVSEAIECVNSGDDDNVKLLMTGDTSPEKKTYIVKTLLFIAHVPMGRVHAIRLVADLQQNPELWLRSSNGENWLYFDMVTGEQSLPSDRLVWWLDDEPLMTIGDGKRAQVGFSLNGSEMNTIRLVKLSDRNTEVAFLEYSLYGLSLSTQQTLQIMTMVPIGVLVILTLRNLIGLQTLGIFTPVLIALVFRETGLQWGIALFTVITTLGLSLHSCLEHPKLQMLPHLSVVSTFAMVMIAVISLFNHKFGFEGGLSIALFPMVILTITVECLSITWEERDGGHAMKAAIGTLLATSLAHILMRIPGLVYLIFALPTVLLILVAFMLVMGRYRGYCLTELFHSRALLKD